MFKGKGGVRKGRGGEVTLLPASQAVNQPSGELTLLKGEERRLTNPPCLSGDLQVPAEAVSHWKKSWN